MTCFTNMQFFIKQFHQVIQFYSENIAFLIVTGFYGKLHKCKRDLVLIAKENSQLYHNLFLLVLYFRYLIFLNFLRRFWSSLVPSFLIYCLNFWIFLIPRFLIIYSNFWIFLVPCSLKFYFVFWVFMVLWFLIFHITVGCTSEFFWYFAFWYVDFSVTFSRYICCLHCFAVSSLLWNLFLTACIFFPLYFLFFAPKSVSRLADFRCFFKANLIAFYSWYWQCSQLL